MAKQGIDIPVTTSGTQQAQAEIRDVAHTIAEAGRAAVTIVPTGIEEWADEVERIDALLNKPKPLPADPTGGLKNLSQFDLESWAAKEEKVAQGAEHAAESTDHFQRKGEILVKSGLRMINPELAMMADLAIDVAEGIGKITPILLAVAGAGVAIGVIVAALNKVEEAAKKARLEFQAFVDAQKEEADKGLETREKAFGALRDAGVLPSEAEQDAMIAGVRKLAFEQGVPQEQAIAALAEQRGRGLDEAGLQQLLGGMALTGKMPQHSGNKGEDNQLFNRIMAAGASDNARAALAAQKAALGEKSIREAPGGQADRVDMTEMIDTELGRAGADGSFSDDELKVLKQIAMRRGAMDEAGAKTLKKQFAPDSRKSAQELMDASDEIADRARARFTGGAAEPETPVSGGDRFARPATAAGQPAGPVTVINNTYINNAYRTDSDWMGQAPASSVEQRINNY